MILFVRGRIIPEHKNPLNRFLIWIYRPVIRLALRFRAATILAALLVLAGSVWPAMKLGSEFMPTLNEGTLFYMPTTFPGLSVTKAASCCRPRTRSSRAFRRSNWFGARRVAP